MVQVDMAKQNHHQKYQEIKNLLTQNTALVQVRVVDLAQQNEIIREFP
jgi:hypothetical protein